MTTAAEVFADAFARIREDVASAVEGVDETTLARRPEGADGVGNSMAWTVWHLSRVQDDHLAEAFGSDQVWPRGWSARFDLPFEESETGYGHTAAEVGAVTASAQLLTGYHDAVTAQTLQLLRGVSNLELDRVLPPTWGEGVTLAERLVSVVGDDMQHIGQVAYLRGLFVT